MDLTLSSPISPNRQKERRGEHHREHEGVRDGVGERSGPLLGGVGRVHGPILFVEAGEGGGSLVGYKNRPEQDEHQPGDEIRGVDSQGPY